MDNAKCCANIDNTVFFPYRRVIRGGKLVILPLRDPAGNLCGFLEPEISKPLPRRVAQDCGCPTGSRRTQDERKQETDKIAPPCFMGTKLNPIIGSEQMEPISFRVKANLKATNQGSCHQDRLTPLQRHAAPQKSTLRDELQARVGHMLLEASKAPDKTPMTLLKNDNRNLHRAITIYKRDLQRQKDKRLISEPLKKFPDEQTKAWYYDKIGENPLCLDRETKNLLHRSDCIYFKDDIHGACFQCPERKLPPIAKTYRKVNTREENVLPALKTADGCDC